MLKEQKGHFFLIIRADLGFQIRVNDFASTARR